jgi:hypothetical protein
MRQPAASETHHAFFPKYLPSLVLCVSSWSFLVEDSYHPLWPQTYLVDDPIKTMFAMRRELLELTSQ